MLIESSKTMWKIGKKQIKPLKNSRNNYSKRTKKLVQKIINKEAKCQYINNK